MPTKRNATEKSQSQSAASRSSHLKKWRVKKERRRTPALVSVPKGLGVLLDLVNLLPIHLRQPFWAQQEYVERQRSPFALHKNDILNWRFDTESSESRLFRWIRRDVPVEWRTNTPNLLWVKLQGMLRELPLALQAFVLHDERGDEAELDGLEPVGGIHPDLRYWRNLSLIKEPELEQIVRDACNRIDQAIEQQPPSRRVQQRRGSNNPKELLLERAHQRLTLVIGLYDLFSYLTDPERRQDSLFAAAFYDTQIARSQVYIDNVGKIQFRPAVIASFLDGIDARRIGQCPVCFKFFWAGRKDMRCCSTPCATALRMRNYRERWEITKQYRSNN